MPILKTLKRRYVRKKQRKKDVAMKKEYAGYRKTYLGEPKHDPKKMQSYAQWKHDKYGKYKKAPAKRTIKRSKPKKPAAAVGLLTSYAKRTGSPKTK